MDVSQTTHYLFRKKSSLLFFLSRCLVRSSLKKTGTEKEDRNGRERERERERVREDEEKRRKERNGEREWPLLFQIVFPAGSLLQKCNILKAETLSLLLPIMSFLHTKSYVVMCLVLSAKFR